MRKPVILVVDDLPENIDLIENVFLGQPYEFLRASNGREALNVVKDNSPDLILLDVVMPEMNGFEVCERLKSDRATRLIPIIMVTGLEDSESKIRGINMGVDDFVSKPINIYELKARVASLLKLKEYTDQLESAERIIFSLALAVEAKDNYTRGHCNRLANYGAMLGQRIGLSEGEIRTIRRGGILHDIGKLAISDSILQKPGPLSEHEFDEIKSHPEAGERICRPLKTLEDVLPVIRHHQERYDGSGYPDGLKGDAIPITARVVAMVDSYDALTTDRPYRKALRGEDAMDVLYAETSEGLWDQNIFTEFKELLKTRNIDRLVNTDVGELQELN